MICPACSTENDAAHDSCFICGQRLSSGPPLTKGSLLAGRYEILSPLGRGGMGMVYRAHDRMLEETVALKVLRPDIAQAPDVARRFRSEIKLARKVTHPNVCRIHDYGEDGSLGYIAMEIVEGMDLKQFRARQGPLSIPQAYEVAVQMAEGLQAIHDAGVVHRDLKTSNVMLDTHGQIRLMDFGIAKQMGATMGATAMGHVVGTPEYMSPEQARGNKLDFRSDIYSMGIVMYEIFTGHVPFRGDTPIATIYLNLEQAPILEGPEAAGIPPALVPVLAKALAKDPRARYDSARELAAALRAARQQSHPATTQASVPLPAPPPVTPAATTSIMPLPGSTNVPTPTPAPSTTPPPQPTVAAAAPTLSAPPPRRVASAPFATSPQMAPVQRPAGPMTPQPREKVAPAQVSAKAPRQRSVLPWLALGAALFLVVVGSLVLLVKQLVDEPPAPEPSTAAVSVTDPSPPAPTTTTSTSSTTTTTTTTIASTTTTLRVAPVAPAAGSLQLVVKPWAEVSVDGAVVGTTPFKPLSLSPGAHSVRFSHPGYRPLQRKVTIQAGKPTRLEIDLKLDAVPKSPSDSRQR